MNITVGLDFGTHQTKVCIEESSRVGREYSFIKFPDQNGTLQYTLPSIICIDENDLLSYGYITPSPQSTIVRYFKQAAFCSSPVPSLKQDDAMLYSCWYIAFILFDLEEKYGQDFGIQMGAPTDSTGQNDKRDIAVQILATAYKLVEHEFDSKEEFLACDLYSLVERTRIIRDVEKQKRDYEILVFPEAYACLKPLIVLGKISTGMNLMIDIGGGTTDISFFTIENDIPQVYGFYSIDKGLNFLTNAHGDSKYIDSNVKDESEINEEKYKIFRKAIFEKCNLIYSKLKRELKAQTEFEVPKLNDALQNRPVVYCGGGSTFKMLRNSYSFFSDVKLIDKSNWKSYAVKEMDEIDSKGLCPILSTAYGLSIYALDDDIICKPFRDIFEHIRIEKKLKVYKDDFNYEDWRERE